MKFSGKVSNGLWNNWLKGGDPDHRLNTGTVFRIRHYWYWEIRKVVSGHKSAAHILLRQMAALVRCALAEVGTVLVFLVYLVKDVVFIR